MDFLKETNILIGEFDDALVKEYFAEDFQRMDNTTVEDLLFKLKVFPSKGQARKNGHVGVIPDGITKLGTKRHAVWVWKVPA